MKTKTALTALTLALGLSVAGPANANDSLPMRAMSALGEVIASQGNAALLQIRAELAEHLLDRLRPQLPAPHEVTPDPQPAPAEHAKN